MKTFGIIVLCIVGIGLLALLNFTCNIISIGAKHVTNSVENAVIDYNQYQDIYNAAHQVDDNIGIINGTNADDEMFKNGFNKSAQLFGLESKMNKLVNDYNALSAHIDAKWWKSTTLPIKLSNSDFPNYVSATHPAK